MYYITKENDQLIKHEINLDEEKLKEIMKMVILECGELKHIKYESTIEPNYYNFDYRVINYSSVKLKEIDHFEYIDNIYLIEYDEYQDTRLSILIRKLLSGDIKVIDELKNPVVLKKDDTLKKSLQDKIKSILAKDIEDINLYEIDNLKEEIKNYQQHEKMNKDRKSDLKYYEQVLKCIKETYVNVLDIKVLESWIKQNNLIKEFYSDTDKLTFEENVKKYIK